MYTHLGLLYITSLCTLHYYVMCLFVLGNFLCSEICCRTVAFFWLVFAWYIFFPSFHIKPICIVIVEVSFLYFYNCLRVQGQVGGSVEREKSCDSWFHSLRMVAKLRERKAPLLQSFESRKLSLMAKATAAMALLGEWRKERGKMRRFLQPLLALWVPFFRTSVLECFPWSCLCLHPGIHYGVE